MKRPLVIGIVVVVLAAGWFLFAKRSKHQQAWHDLRELQIGLDAYLKDQGNYPQGTTAEICTLLLGTPLGDQNQRRLVYIEARPREINAAGEFVDPWGSPYRIVTSGTLALYSCGPNRVDEQGRGDDLATVRR